MPVGTFNNITADSVPVLDGWGYDYFWGCQHWTKWHSLMVVKYGIKYANDKFIEEWEKMGIGASPVNCRTFNPTFQEYAKKYGFFQALFSGAAVLAYPIAVVTDVLFDAGKVVENTTESIVNISESTKSVLKWAFPVGLGLVGAFAVYKYLYIPFKKEKKSA